MIRSCTASVLGGPGSLILKAITAVLPEIGWSLNETTQRQTRPSSLTYTSSTLTP